jgi:hypothetical protein
VQVALAHQLKILQEMMELSVASMELLPMAVVQVAVVVHSLDLSIQEELAALPAAEIDSD